MKMMIALSLCALAGACAPTKPAVEEFDPPAAAANGMQLRMKEVQNLHPGTSYEYCTWTDQITQKDLEIKSMQGFQTKLGHHVILFYTSKTLPPGTTRECTDEDMASFRFAGASGGEGIESVAPGDLVHHVPKGMQLVVNHHYLNASQEMATGESALNIRFADPGVKSVRAGSLAFVNTELKLPPGRSTMDFSCTMTRSEKIWRMIPHMHRWGTYTSVDIVRAGKAERMFDQKWDESYTFHPPEYNRPLDQPMELGVGDQVKVHCEWDNPTSKPLTFGMEMCVAFGNTINAEQRENIACDNGEWTAF